MIFYMIIIGLIWGSFLNVVAYRFMNNKSILWPRSMCPSCNRMIAWYDNIPCLSWLLLHGKCRNCNASISLFYPFIECTTALTIVALYNTTTLPYLLTYLIVFSALLITTRTDLEHMLIIQEVCLYPMLATIGLSILGYAPITALQSIAGAIFGYLLLWGISRIYYLCTHTEGLGDGDAYVLALIGSCTGIFGVISTLCIASWIGSIVGICYLMIHKQDKSQPIPFVPFLALAALIYVCMQEYIHAFASVL